MFDPACLPAPVQLQLAVIGYRVCSPDLRDKLADWDGLDVWRRGAAARDLDRLAEALAH